MFAFSRTIKEILSFSFLAKKYFGFINFNNRKYWNENITPKNTIENAAVSR
jgi:hypothetical protein